MNIYNLIFLLICSMASDIATKKASLFSLLKKNDWIQPHSINHSLIHFRNPSTNKCLTGTGVKKVGQNFHLWDCDNKNNSQRFLIMEAFGAPKGWFNILGYTGLCVSAKNRGLLFQEKCGKSEDLLWNIYERKKGGIIVKSKSGLQMDNAGQISKNGNPILSWSRNNGKNQRWAIEYIETSEYFQFALFFNSLFHFRNPHTGKCVNEQGEKDGKGYDLWECSRENKNQSFSLKTPENAPLGWFNIIGHSGLCVSSKQHRGRLVQEKCGISNDLLWSGNEKHSNGYIIRNRSGQQMDNRGRRSDNGNPILGWKRNNSPAQIWLIEYAQGDEKLESHDEDEHDEEEEPYEPHEEVETPNEEDANDLS